MALTAQECRDLVRIVFLCMFWYAVSSSNGVLGKWILSEFPFPMTLTMVQLTSIAVYSGPMLSLMGVRGASACSVISWKYYFTFIFPLAFAKFGSSVMSHISIWKVPVSYAHTVKATMPLFTVAISRVLFSEKHSWSVYLSLAPIIMGVAVATITEVSFDVLGLGSALAATAGFSMMNIFSKKALKDTGMHHLRLLCTLGRISCLMFLPIWLLFDSRQVAANLMDENNLSSSVVFLLVVDGVTHWLQNILAFTILKLVAPLTYAVANVTKRISIISVSILLIGNQVTSSNVFGMLLAIFGVFYYNKVKYDENRAKSSLPTTFKNDLPKTSSILWNAQPGVAEDSFQRVKLSSSKPTAAAAITAATAAPMSNGFTTYTNYQQSNGTTAHLQHYGNGTLANHHNSNGTLGNHHHNSNGTLGNHHNSNGSLANHHYGNGSAHQNGYLANNTYVAPKASNGYPNNSSYYGTSQGPYGNSGYSMSNGYSTGNRKDI